MRACAALIDDTYVGQGHRHLLGVDGLFVIDVLIGASWEYRGDYESISIPESQSTRE